MKRQQVGAVFFLLAVISLLATGTGCCIFFPGPGKAVEDFSLATPERAFDSFKRAFKAENPSLEWKCFSDALKEREGLTWAKYRMGRARFIAKYHDAIENLKRAELKGIFPLSADRKRIVLDVRGPGAVAKLLLINQPYFEFVMSRDGEEELVWGLLDRLESHIVRFDENGREMVQLRIPLDEAFDESIAGFDREKIVRFTMENEWKLFDLEIYLDEEVYPDVLKDVD